MKQNKYIRNLIEETAINDITTQFAHAGDALLGSLASGYCAVELALSMAQQNYSHGLIVYGALSSSAAVGVVVTAMARPCARLVRYFAHKNP
jgi:hypothetical protein